MSKAPSPFDGMRQTGCFQFEEGHHVAVIFTIGITWTWVVFHDATVIGGMSDWDMDATTAILQAKACIKVDQERRAAT